MHLFYDLFGIQRKCSNNYKHNFSPKILTLKGKDIEAKPQDTVVRGLVFKSFLNYSVMSVEN